MSDTNPTTIEQMMPATVPAPYMTTHRRSLRLKNLDGDRDFTKLLRQMRKASGLSLRALADRMGLKSRESLSRYFSQMKGRGGTSRMSWFLRYAAACGCTVWVTMPSGKEQTELVRQYARPIGNPNWVKREKVDG